MDSRKLKLTEKGQPRCIAKNKKGERCKSWAMKGCDYCYFHNPELADQRKKDRSLGGKRKGFKEVPLPDTASDADWLVLQLRHTLETALENNTKIPQSLMAGFREYRQALEHRINYGDLSDRIDELERRIE